MNENEELQLLSASAAGAVRSKSEWPEGTSSEHWLAGWQRLEQQGLLELFRAGGRVRDAVVVHEEAGRWLFGGPLVAASAADLVLSRLGDDAPSGRVLLAPAVGPLGLSEAGEDVRLTGRLQAPDPAVVDVWLVHDAATGRLLVAQAQDLALQPSPRSTFDSSRRHGVAEVVALPARALPAPAGEGLADVVGLLTCADAVGALDRAVTMTADYARERQTFGSPIARNQAVAYPLVRHSLTVLQARLLVQRAAEALDAGDPEARALVLAAQTLLSARGFEAVSECVQLAGGIGFTWEYGLHHLARRVAVDVGLLGGVQHVRSDLAREHGWQHADA